MKNSIKSLLMAILAGGATVAVAADGEKYTFSEFTPIEFVDGSRWYTPHGAATNDLGAIKVRTGSLDNLYFEFNSGDEILYRTINPVAYNSASNTLYMQGFKLEEGSAVYFQADVKLATSDEPQVAADNRDKLIVWLNPDGKVCVKAGYYQKSLGASGVVPKTYVTTNEVAESTWHTLTVKAYRPLTLGQPNSAFELALDGQALHIYQESGDTVVAPALKAAFESYLEEGIAAYYDDRLFPSLVADSDAALVYALGANGAGGGLDNLATFTNSVPASGVPESSRYFVLDCPAGIESFKYAPTGAELKTANLGSKRGQVSIAISTGEDEVSISDVELTIATDTCQLIADSYGVGVNGAVFTIPSGFATARGHLELSHSPFVCTLAGSGDSAIDQGYDTIYAALTNANAQSVTEELTLTLNRSWAECIVVSNLTLTLDLQGHTLSSDAYGDENPVVITVAGTAQLTITDSGVEGAVNAGNAAGYALVCAKDASVDIKGGYFYSEVLKNGGPKTLTGGRYYANTKGGEFDLADCVDLDHYKIDDSNPAYYEVQAKTMGLTAAKLAAASTVLSLSAPEVATLAKDEALPAIEIVSMAHTLEDDKTVIVCIVAVVNSVTRELIPSTPVSLADIVQVSTDLVNWQKPAEITYEPLDDGTCQVKLYLPDGDNYFVRLSDQE